MDRLHSQIKDARASLQRYSQTSPDRSHFAQIAEPAIQLHQQQRSSTGERSRGSLNRGEDHPAREAYQEYTHVQNVRGRSHNSSNNLRQRSNSNECVGDGGERSRPSTDLQEVQGGYTEFFSWGNDDRGQLGHGVDHSSQGRTLNLPKSLSFEVLISQVACGAQHSSFLTNDGHVFSFGSNVDGQLGIDDRNLNNSTAPLLISSLLQAGQLAKKISCGSYHTLVLMETGDVFSWGRNSQGQCGQSLNTAPCFFGPQRLQFEASHPISQIECGDLNSALITKAGQLYTFGDNSQGQLGLGNGVFSSQLLVDKPTRVQEIFDEVVQISCGYRHCLALTVKGAIYGFGSNRRHEMGLGEAPIAQENNFFAPMKLDQLEIHNIVHCAAGGFSAAITDLKQLIVWGTGQFGVFNTPQKVCMDGIYFRDIQISKQETSFASAVDRRGAIYSWGPNFDGQLGQGDFSTRTLPVQIGRLKRKQIKQTALGDRFSIAIGKDVSTADLMRRKAAKAKKQQNQNVDRAVVQHDRQNSRIDHEIDNYPQRQSSLRQSAPRGGAPNYSRERHENLDPMRNCCDNDKTGSKHETTNVRIKVVKMSGDSRPLRESSMKKVGIDGDDRESQAIYSNFALTTNLNNVLNNDNSQGAGTGNQSPLRQKSRDNSVDYISAQEVSAKFAPSRSQEQIAVGGQRVSAEKDYQPANVRLVIKQENVAHFRPPIDVQAPSLRQKSPGGFTAQPAVLSQGSGSAKKFDEPSRSSHNVERLFKMQLEEKEIVIRRQQETIQELRVEITNDQRLAGQRHDEVTDKLRNCEVERNDLRTRLASELRSYQGSKQEMMSQISELESEIQRLIGQHESRTTMLQQEAHAQISELESEIQRLVGQHESRTTMLQQEARDHETQRIGTLEITHRNQVNLYEEKNRQTLNEMESIRNKLQDELQSARSALDHERSKLHQAYEDNSRLEGEYQQMHDSKTANVRDLQDQVERHINHIKALEIEKDTLNERNHVTVSQLKQEITELLRQISLKNARLDEASAKEDDYRRLIDHEKDMVHRRDEQIDDNMNEITVLRKQIEDQHLKICSIEASKSDLDQSFQDLHIQFTTLQEKMRNEQQHSQNLDNQLQSTRLQLERERQRCEATQADLDAQNAGNIALRRELTDADHKMNSREQDIRNLEQSLQALKDSMGAEYAAKSRDFESLKCAYEDLRMSQEQTSDALNARNDELNSAHVMNRELQSHATALLEKVSYQENVIFELEEKNKRLTDLLNSHLYDQAQNYKEAVLSKLTGSCGHNTRNVQPNQMTDLVTGRFVASPFTDMTNQRSRSMTPERNDRVPQNVFYDNPVNTSDSHQRLSQILRSKPGNSDALNKNYLVQQQQLNKEKFHKSPIRSHELNLAAEAGGTVSMANIPGPTDSPVRRSRSPLRHNNLTQVPLANFATQPYIGGANISSELGQSKRQSAQGSTGDNNSPLRSQKSPRPKSMKERQRDATQAASLGYSQLKGNLVSSMSKQPGLPNFSASMGVKNQVPQQYSPLRSKTPTEEKRVANDQEQVQLGTQTISASNISHRVMMNELRNLRGQIANVQRQKSELETRLNGYEATQMP